MRSEGYPHKWKSCEALSSLPEKKREIIYLYFSGVTHSRKSGNCTDAAGVRRGITYTVPCKCCMKKWRCFSMRNPKLVPYETIVRATSGEPEAIDEVLRHTASESGLLPLKTDRSTRTQRTTLNGGLSLPCSSSALTDSLPNRR